MRHEESFPSTTELSSSAREGSHLSEQEQLVGKTPMPEPQRQILLERASEPRMPARQRQASQRFRSWFMNSTFAPAWLPENLQHPFFGYLIALLLQALAVWATVYLDRVFGGFVFASLFEVLAIALVALSWGVGPSVVATLLGAGLFEYIVLSPQFTWHVNNLKDISQLLLFILIGLTISIVASQTESARRRAERLANSLTKEHARLEAIIETVPDIVAIYDKHGRMVQMNEIGRQNRIFDPDMRVRSLEELLKRHEAFTLDGQPVDVDNLPTVRALRGETVESQEIRLFTSEGSELFLSISAAPLRNIHGRIDGVVSVTRDLSALHRFEREAANHAIELEAIFQSLADGMYVVDKAGMIIRSNTAFQEIIDYTEENRDQFFEFSPDERHSILDIRDEQGQPLAYEERPETRILQGEVLKGSSVVDLHLRNLVGRELQVNVSGAPLYNREGELVAALCICRDVTERRKLEQRTHDALDALLTMAEALVAYKDEEEQSTRGTSRKIALRMARLTSRVLACSRASLFLVEPTGESLSLLATVGRSSFSEEQDLTALEPTSRAMQMFPIAQLPTRLQGGEFVLQDTRIEPFTTWLRDYPTHMALVVPMNMDQQLIGLLVLGQDEPEYVYGQEEIALAGAVAQLLALVFERERLLHEQAEAQATELALRAANRHMEEFLGMVSHELKTPLTSIKGNTQLAIRQLRNSMQTFERIFGLYEAAEQQTRRLNRLVDDLLDVSRAQAGHLELIPGRCDLRELVHEALQEQQRMWPGRAINLEIDERLALPLDADADRVMQVITNYLTNALKYSEPERPIFVCVERQNNEAYLAVRDEGPGLPLDQQERIWGRFNRAPGIEVLSTAHSSQAGLGLGLYISRTIIEGQGGSVGVQSRPGEGSTFWFRLPLRSMAE